MKKAKYRRVSLIYYLLCKKELKIKCTNIYCLATKRHRKDTPDNNEMGYLQRVGGNVKSRGNGKGKDNSLNIPFCTYPTFRTMLMLHILKKKSQ